MNTTNIITEFELQVSDITELSSAEELLVANRVYTKICNDRPWEFLKSSVAGSVLSDAVGSYITPPEDFASFSENLGYSQNNDATQNNTTPKVIFIGTNYSPYTIINFSDRRQYRNRQGFVYYDTANNIIRFTYPPEASTYEFDYIKVAPALTLETSPLFPARFYNAIVFGMAVDNQIIELSPKASFYAAENETKYQGVLSDMKYWNASLIQM